jgi:hypothetical protein
MHQFRAAVTKYKGLKQTETPSGESSALGGFRMQRAHSPMLFPLTDSSA